MITDSPQAITDKLTELIARAIPHKASDCWATREQKNRSREELKKEILKLFGCVK